MGKVCSRRPVLVADHWKDLDDRRPQHCVLPPFVVALLAKFSGPTRTDLLEHFRFLKLDCLLHQFLCHDLLDFSHDLQHSVAHFGVIREVEAFLLRTLLLLHFPEPADCVPQALLGS